MDLMARLVQNPWSLLVFSTLVAICTGVAIMGFGAPPKVLVPITFATCAIGAGMSEWADQRLGRR
ncbi:MAG TPA: hypothetical protein VFX85_09680 [Solirubrobacterales bacterium]|nr:hypothetical protein [Solirubrobacterales bacterium]